MSNDVLQFHRLIERIKAKDEIALEEFHNLFWKLIYYAAYSVSHSRSIADETINDVLIKVWQYPQNLNKISKPKSWIFKVSTNCAIDNIRKNKDFEKIFDIVATHPYLESESKLDFINLIKPLSDFEQQILTLKFVYGFKFKEIAKELDKPLSSITSIYYRALEKIKCKYL